MIKLRTDPTGVEGEYNGRNKSDDGWGQTSGGANGDEEDTDRAS